VTDSTFLLPRFAGSFIFVAETVRQTFRLCSFFKADSGTPFSSAKKL